MRTASAWKGGNPSREGRGKRSECVRRSQSIEMRTLGGMSTLTILTCSRKGQHIAFAMIDPNYMAELHSKYSTS